MRIQEYRKNSMMIAVDKLPLISLTENDKLVQKACDAVMMAFPIKPPYESAMFKRVPRTGGCTSG